MLLNADELRRLVMQEFDYWADHGLGDGVTALQIDVHTYRKPGEQVRSLGKRDPQHSKELTPVRNGR